MLTLTDPAWRQDDDDREYDGDDACSTCGETPCDCPGSLTDEELGEAIRGQFPEMIERATQGELIQLQDEELMI